MAAPEIKIIALSNIFSRMMFFNKKGDIEEGHKHTYDHATQISHGSVLVEVIDNNGRIVSGKVFNAPDMIFIDKNKYHRIIALEDKTVCSCIHAIKTLDEEIVDPDFLIEPLLSTNNGELRMVVEEKYKKNMLPFTVE
jgi:quercetin dioxygenase-like cupin family protein